VLPLAAIGEAVKTAIDDLAKLVGGDPFALIVCEKDLAFRAGAPPTGLRKPKASSRGD
jgi:hypothetical protein